MVSTRSSSAAKLGTAPPRALKRRKVEVEEDTGAEARAEHGTSYQPFNIEECTYQFIEAITSEMNIIVQTERVAQTKRKAVRPAMKEEVPSQGLSYFMAPLVTAGLTFL